MEDTAAEGDEAVVPSYAFWILATGSAAIVISILAIAILTDLIKLPWSFSDRNLAAAYLLAVLASFNLLVMHSVVHGLSPAAGHEQARVGMGWNEAFFWRSIFCLVLASPYYMSPTLFSFLKLGDTCGTEEESPLRDDEQDNSLLVSSKVWGLMLRGALGVLAGILIFAGVSYLPQSEAVALYATAPFWSILFSYLLLGEMLNGPVILCMVACFAGALMILEPWTLLTPAHVQHNSLSFSPSETTAIVASTLCLLAGATVGIVGPLIRSMLRVHVMELVLWLGIIGVVATSFVAVAFQVCKRCTC